MNRRSLPSVAFAGCAAIWSSTFLAVRMGDETLPALWACTLRMILAAMLLNLYRIAIKEPWPKGKALAAATGYGVIEFGLCLPLLYWGEKMVSSGLAAVLYAVSPVAAMAAERALGLGKWNATKLAAAGLALAGVGIIFWRQVQMGGASVPGLAAIGFAATVGAMAPVLLQLGPKQSALGANSFGSLIAIPPALIASFALGESHPLPVRFDQYFPVVYLAVASSVIAFGLFAWLINHWKASTIAFLGVVVPVCALVLGALVRNEKFEVGILVGGAVVMGAVLVAIRSERSVQVKDEALGSPAGLEELAEIDHDRLEPCSR